MTSMRQAGVVGSLPLSRRRSSICPASDDVTRSSFLSQPRTRSVPEATQSVTVTSGLTGIDRCTLPPGVSAPFDSFFALYAGVVPAREKKRPATARTTNNFIVNLGPGLSVRTTSTQTGVGDRVEKIDLALIGSKHEIGRVGIVWIALGSIAGRGDGAIDNGEIALVFNLQRWSHCFLVRLDRRIEPGNGLEVRAFTRDEPYGVVFDGHRTRRIFDSLWSHKMTLRNHGFISIIGYFNRGWFIEF